MNIVILDDYQDAVRKLDCAAKLENFPAKVYTNTIKGIGQLSVRLKDADIIVLIRERTHLTRAVIEKLPRLKMIAQTGRLGSHIDLAACTERGVAVAEGVGSPVAPAELTWALIMASARRLPQYIGNLKHGAWQQSGLKAGSMPANFGLGTVLNGKTWAFGASEKLASWWPDMARRLAWMSYFGAVMNPAPKPSSRATWRQPAAPHFLNNPMCCHSICATTTPPVGSSREKTWAA
jgi:D-3-phosphoglycerate dehydrogenase